MRRLFKYDKDLCRVVEIAYSTVDNPTVYIINDKLADGNYVRSHAHGLEENDKAYFESKSRYKREVAARGKEIVGNDYVGVDPVKYLQKQEKQVDWRHELNKTINMLKWKN